MSLNCEWNLWGSAGAYVIVRQLSTTVPELLAELQPHASRKVLYELCTRVPLIPVTEAYLPVKQPPLYPLIHTWTHSHSVLPPLLWFPLVDHLPGLQGSQLRPHACFLYVYKTSIKVNECYSCQRICVYFLDSVTKEHTTDLQHTRETDSYM